MRGQVAKPRLAIGRAGQPAETKRGKPPRLPSWPGRLRTGGVVGVTPRVLPATWLRVFAEVEVGEVGLRAVGGELDAGLEWFVEHERVAVEGREAG